MREEATTQGAALVNAIASASRGPLPPPRSEPLTTFPNRVEVMCPSRGHVLCVRDMQPGAFSASCAFPPSCPASKKLSFR